MRIGLLVICGFALLALVSGSPVKCSDCNKNECECKRKILKASTVAPSRFTKTKICAETNPTDLHPIKDICSCTDVAQVRPHSRNNEDTPRFAHSTSCECGYEESQPESQPVKYSADAVSQHLAIIAARKKEISVSETDLHFHGKAIRIPSEGSNVPDIKEERLHKFNRQLIELKPAKKKQVYRPESSEEEDFPCQPEQQSYSEICYGKVQAHNPKFEHVYEEAAPCEVCQDTYSDEKHGKSYGEKKYGSSEQHHSEQQEEDEGEEEEEEEEEQESNGEEEYEEREEIREESRESKYEKKTESKYGKKTESKYVKKTESKSSGYSKESGYSETEESGYSEDEESEYSEDDENESEAEEEEEEDEEEEQEEEEENEDDEESSYEAPKKDCEKKKKHIPYKKRSLRLSQLLGVKGGSKVANSNTLKQ